MGLLSNIASKKEAETKVEQIEVDKIIPDPNQPRKVFEGIEALAETIKKYGLLNPIHIQKQGENYIIISGERRWRAFKEYTDFKVIPCFVISEKDTKTIQLLQLIENVQRADLNPLEEAQAYKNILETKEINQKNLAAEIGISETAISRSLKLMSLPQKIKDELQSNPDIPKSLLIEIAGEKDLERQIELWEQIAQGKIQKREELRQERKGLKKKEIMAMDADRIWEIIKRAVRRDKEIIKKIVNSAQLEKLLNEGEEDSKEQKQE